MQNKYAPQLSAAVLAGAYACYHVFYYYAAIKYRADYLYWDPAAHAYYGIKLAEALHSLNPLRVILVINEQVLWPPLHSVLQLPFLLVLDKSFLTSSICSFVFLFLFFPALALCYRQISHSWSGLAVLLSLGVTSPLFVAYGSMPMLEIFGAVFTVISATLYLRKSRWFPASLSLLFFLKYNYCLYVLLAFAAVELLPGFIRALKQHRHRILRLLSPFQWFTGVYFLCLILILLTGGFQIGKMSVRGIGNPLYILFVIVLLRIFIRRKYAQIWFRLKDTGWGWFLIPVCLWLLIPIPNRVKTLVNFAINVPLSGHSPTEPEYYTFYFQNMGAYFASPIILILCAVLAVAFAIRNIRNQKIQFLAALFVLPLLLMTLNQNKQDRYLYTFMFSFWILAAGSVAALRYRILQALGAAIMCAASFITFDGSRTGEFVRWPFIPVKMDAPLGFIATELKDADSVIVTGVSNELSPALIAYHVRKQQGFRGDPRFAWELEDPMAVGTHIIALGRQEISASAKLLKQQSFPGSMEIRHFVVPN